MNIIEKIYIGILIAFVILTLIFGVEAVLPFYTPTQSLDGSITFGSTDTSTSTSEHVPDTHPIIPPTSSSTPQ